jgi:hypothetical protein
MNRPHPAQIPRALPNLESWCKPFLGPLLILLCILGGVVKKFQWGGGRFSVETNESPFMSWRRHSTMG